MALTDGYERKGDDIDASLAARLWGKSRGLSAPYPLAGHLIDTSALARVLLNEVIPAGLQDALSRQGRRTWSEVESSIVNLAGWHDVGKASCGFQNLVKSACPVELQGLKDGSRVSGHDQAGAYLAWDRLGDLGWRTQACQIIGGHHGVIPAAPSPMIRRFGGATAVDGVESFDGLTSARDELLALVADATGAKFVELSAEAPFAVVSLAVVVLADWLASQEWFLQAQQQRHTVFDPVIWYRHAEELARVAVREAGLMSAPLRRCNPEVLFPFPLSRLQSSIAKQFHPSGAGIMVITAPTGEGKTEAALLAARAFGEATGRSGFFFAMPTTSTADALVGRLSRFIAEANGPEAHLGLVHSLASMHPSSHRRNSSDTETAVQASRWLRGGRRGVLGPFAVGTIDQVLLGGLRVKHSPLRLFGAATKTLIVDEAHTFDPYMRGLLVRVLEWLGALDVPVVVASATLPSLRAGELVDAYRRGTGKADGPVPDIPYPGWVAWNANNGEFMGESLPARLSWQLRLRVEPTPDGELLNRIAASAVDACRDGGCVLLVRSTVKEAQRTAMAVRALDPELEVGLLHARLKVGERRSRAEDLERRFGPGANRPHRYVLVATQIVEQSLDVDFDTLICDLAPVAQLLQRAGRVHRHEGRQRPQRHAEPVATAFVPHNTSAPVLRSPIYAEADLRAAFELLGSERLIEVPGGVKELVEEADRFSLNGDSAWDKAASDRDVAIDVDTAAAAAVRIPAPDRVADLSDLTSVADPDLLVAGTRLGTGSIRVLPVWETAIGFTSFPKTGEPLPAEAPTGEDLRRLFDETIAVPDYGRPWLRSLLDTPEGWQRTPLGEVRLLVLDNGTYSATVAGWRVTLDPYLGLVDERSAR